MSWLDDDLTTVALCWRLDRRDGAALGFTAHDRDLLIDGLPYRAAPGMTPAAIALTDAFAVDRLEVAGALTDDLITEADLAAGRWDGAAVRLFATDWRTPGESLPLARGTLGEVHRQDGAFTAELAGPTAVLGMGVGIATSPDCRATLGDKACRVDLAPLTRFVRLVDVADATLTLDQSEPGANSYAGGRLWWVDGPLAGLRAPIVASADRTVTLAEPPDPAPTPGTLLRVQQGCDRTIATCAARFSNAVNFRGEPYLPGNDLLTRYPGA